MELRGWSEHPGQGPPYAVGLEWMRGCRWELHSLEPSGTPRTWQHGSSPAPSYWLCRKHGIFRIWGSLERGGRGGLDRRLLLLQQEGQNSRKEEGPDEPLFWPLLGSERGVRGRFSSLMSTASLQPEPCAGSCTPASPSLKKGRQPLGWVSEARAVLASILPSHQGQLCTVYCCGGFYQNLKLLVPKYT